MRPSLRDRGSNEPLCQRIVDYALATIALVYLAGACVLERAGLIRGRGGMIAAHEPKREG